MTARENNERLETDEASDRVETAGPSSDDALAAAGFSPGRQHRLSVRLGRPRNRLRISE